MNRNNLLRILLSFTLAGIMLFLCFKYMMKPDERKMLFENPLSSHLASIGFCILTFILSGIELRYVYSQTTDTKLSLYDTFTLPFVMNLFGFIIPFQGSFFYMTFYLTSKYKFKAPDIIYVYLYLFLLSVCIAGLAGLTFCLIYGIKNVVFISLCTIFLINPLMVYIANFIFSHITFKWVLPNKIATHVKYIVSNINLVYKQRELLIMMVLFNLGSTFTQAMWGYSISCFWHLQIAFPVFLILAFLLRLLVIFKFTPGNLGTTQFFAGLFFFTIGLKVTNVVSITLFQTISTLLVAFTIGAFVFLLNFRFTRLLR